MRETCRRQECLDEPAAATGFCLTHDLEYLWAIESALTPEQLGGVLQMAHAIGLDVDAWLAVPALEQVASMAAVANVARELRAEGYSETAALRAAAERIGVDEETARTRWRRWRQAAEPVGSI